VIHFACGFPAGVVEKRQVVNCLSGLHDWSVAVLFTAWGGREIDFPIGPIRGVDGNEHLMSRHSPEPKKGY
jgi:hypothetical protein